MKTEAILISSFIIIFLITGFYTSAMKSPTISASIIRVPKDYPTIQAAVDASNPGDTILVANGIYRENVILYKENLTLLGENAETTVIDSRGIGEVVYITASHLYISGFTIRNGYCGIYLDHANNISIIRNTITDNFEYGTYLDSSSNNTIRENAIFNNWLGIFLWHSSRNVIYHNNFNNTIQVHAEDSTNTWDGGYPLGGNYWSDYAEADKLSGPYQNLTGSDGIGDTPYIIDTENKDRYPLTKPYSPHDVGIIKVAPSKTLIPKGEKLNINITTLNYGIYTETFNITAYANEIEIQTQTLTQPSRTSITITFVWETSNIDKGTYIIRAYITPVQGEIDSTDNTFVDGIVFIDILTIGGGCNSRPNHLLK